MAAMAALALALASLLAAWLLGSLPLGAWLVFRATGRDPNEVNPHRLGVETVFRLLGPVLAVAAFSLDLLKGAVAVAALPDTPWAAFGVVAGHLHPVPLPGLREAPRGRGNGVLLGALATLVALGLVPGLTALVGVVVYAAALAWWRWVAPATLLGLLAMALLGWWSSVGPVLVAWTALLAWRHRNALGRIADGTEPRLGDPPAVRELAPGTVVAAFLVHPMTLDDLWQLRSQAWTMRLRRRGWLPDPLLRRALRMLRPQPYGVLRGVRLPDGRELQVLILGGAMLPEQIRAHPEAAERMAIRAARLAHELGAEAFGLGAYWSTVGDKGRSVQRAVPQLAVTNGGAYTAATVRAAVPGLLRRFEGEGGRLAEATAAVVGANGVVAFGVARLVAPEVKTLLLVGRDPRRLQRSAATLARKHPQLEVRTSVDVAAVAAADLVFTATSSPEPVIHAEHVKPGAWLFDLGRPADVDPGVRAVPGVHLVPGGVVRPPGSAHSELDLHFGDGLVPACLAETMILAATGARERASLGPVTRSEDIHWYLRQAEALGFEVVTRDDHVAEAREPV